MRVCTTLIPDLFSVVGLFGEDEASMRQTLITISADEHKCCSRRPSRLPQGAQERTLVAGSPGAGGGFSPVLPQLFSDLVHYGRAGFCRYVNEQFCN